MIVQRGSLWSEGILQVEQRPATDVRRGLGSFRKLNNCRRWTSRLLVVELTHQFVKYELVCTQLSGGDRKRVGYLKVEGRIG